MALGDFCKKPFPKVQKKTSENDKQNFLGFLPNNNDTNMYSSISFSWENDILLNKLFIPGGRLIYFPKRIAGAKSCSNQCCKIKNIWKICLWCLHLS